MSALGQIGPENYPNVFASIAAQTPETVRTNLDDWGLIPPNYVELGGLCLAQSAPDGVPQGTYTGACLKLLAGGLFEPHRKMNAAAEDLLFALAPVPSCLDASHIAGWQYCADHPDFQGPNALSNGLCWMATRSDRYVLTAYGAPHCDGTEVDVDVNLSSGAPDDSFPMTLGPCLTFEQAFQVGNCIGGAPGHEEWCARNVAWVENARARPWCADAIQHGLSLVPSPPPCRDEEVTDFLAYCQAEGSRGPNAVKNAGCWAFSATGLMGQAEALPPCNGADAGGGLFTPGGDLIDSGAADEDEEDRLQAKAGMPWGWIAGGVGIVAVGLFMLTRRKKT